MSTQPEGRRPTIRTVADRAGVSKSLVSLVIRNSPNVSPERRAAVQVAMDELGYRPNASARALAEDRTRLIAVLVNDLRNPWYIHALEGINALLHRRDLRMMIGDQRLDLLGDEVLTAAFLEMDVDGLVITGSMVQSERLIHTATHLPTVVVGSRSLALPRGDLVCNDDEQGSRLAVDHLVGHGHRSIAFLNAPTDAAIFREQGYRDTIAGHGLETFVDMDDPSEDGGYRATVRLLTANPRLTAIFAYNDLMALGALSAAEQLGLDVPGDLSIVGYDDTTMAQLKAISLTTVDNASYRIGYRAADLLVDRIAAPSRPPQTLLLEPQLVVRRTTGPAPTD
ncbi:transcriptional regulator, LacI family [Tessaracoccus bendigoensis DSM 12906]|uniref:Transcriptional regulator, LacI family n=1 Tax=Tessaracoccus bendigoensis DSM 12906 TaxID=1123357 RepID=A0A1M6ET59_9ACTN|nr:LacI family DNA-binding transcriptional regulator [Tessaracoccus bendigoensis]SHI88667.1 transcriptional regulator, LacI family [Tessaracoccus bendigoensis DSM 12906]